MECLISIVGSIAGKAVEYTVDPIARQLSYLFNHKSKFQNLRSKVEELKDARERVEQPVQEAKRKGEEIHGDVDRWLTEVNEKLSDQAATQLREDEEKAMKWCVAGFCPDFKSRYQLSKKAEKQANAIAQLLNTKDQFKEVSYPPRLEGIVTRPVKDYKAYESRTGALNWIMAALEDDNLNIIGVNGMGGVGKTTLVKEVARQAKDKQLFDEVVFVAITQTPNTVNIQCEIAEKLGLKIDETSMDVRAARLRERLKKEKKVLIILDDIWVTSDLEELGIPSRDEHKGCKILITSRKLDVLESMNSQKNLTIEILGEDEAWNLFKNVAGQIVERSDLQRTAIEVAKKCAGLPLAVATVAKALKRKQNLFEWKNALLELKRPSERNFEGIPADAYSALELSYKFLEVKEHRPIFLLCSIMGHDATIEDLLRYGRGLGLFHGVNSMEETRDKVLTLVSNLKASCLLLDGSKPDQFDMHDVVRDVAISIASRDKHWLVLGKDDVFKKWSDEEAMKNCNLISLRDAEVSELLDHELECPGLTFFSIGSKDSSLKIPNKFFEGMKRLKVLVFSEMHFSSLPSSVGFLKTLCTLCLLDCYLEDIVIIGELENLEILSLSGSRIAMLPKETGQLSRLKSLNLSHCHELEVISPNVLSSLSRLEELYLYNSFDRWEVDGHDNPRRNASLVELQHLCHLTALEVHIPNKQAMPEENMFFAKLERFKISIGRKQWKFDWSQMSRILELVTDKSIYLYDGVKMLLRKTESLYLDGVKDAMNMLCDPFTESFQHLKHLSVDNVSDIKSVLDSKKLVCCKAFPHLESLSLRYLNNLEAICDGQLKAESFGRLKVIRVKGCKMLKNLFPFSMARELRQLEEIKVRDCENMTELIVEEREEEIVENGVIEFSQLRILKLTGVLSFIGFCYSEKKHTSSQQERVQPNARWLFDQKVLFPTMKELKLESIDSIEKLWPDQVPLMSFGVQNLTSLGLSNCNNLKYVFTSSTFKSFVQLKKLEVSGCDKMEEVIEGILAGEEEKISGSIEVFPKLDSLELSWLPNLKRFCCGIGPIEFPFLKSLTIGNCPILSTFCSSVDKSRSNIPMDRNLCTNVPQSHYLFNEKVSFPVLEYLCIHSMENLERLWSYQLAEDSFSKLFCIRLFCCPKLLYVFQLSQLTRLQRLEKLTIHECKLLEEIFESQSQEEGSSAIQPLSPQVIQSDVITSDFPRLRYLGLYGLPKLKSFCRKIQTINCPSLERIQVGECDEVETLFASQETSGKSQHVISIQQPLFWVNKFTFPKLRELTLDWNKGMKEIWHGEQLLSDYFGNLKVEGRVNHEQGAILPSRLFQLLSLPNLETLEIRWCRFKEIFQSEGVGGEEMPAWVVHSRITELWLESLDELMHLWKEKEGFPNLKILRVEECPKLKTNLVRSTVSFQNLVTLKVSECNGIIKLITHSTAKSLGQLKEMTISSCEGIREMIEGGDDAQDEISFPQLKSLKLIRLPQLESFCSSRNYTFGFPSLQTVIVDNCPNLKKFSQGQSNTRMLRKVQLHERGNEWHWKGNINSTIQQLFKERHSKAKEGENCEEDQGSPSTSNTEGSRRGNG